MNRILLVFSIASVLLIQSCITSKKATTDAVTSDQINTYLEAIKQNEFDYEWLSMRSSVNLSGTVKLPINNLNFNIRMRKDSVIWVSVSALLNIEGARFLITPDSIRMIDKLKSTYMVRPFDQIQQYIPVPVTFNDLENLIIGNAFLFDPQQSRLEEKNKELNTFICALNNITNESQFDASTSKLNRVFLKDGRIQQESTIDYNEYTSVEEQLFPIKREIQLISKDTLNVSMNFSRIKINQKLNFPFKYSSKYEKL